MAQRRIGLLFALLGVMAASAGIGWHAGTRIESPAEAAARTAPPKPSPILAPVERRVLSSNIITRGTARFGLPYPVAVVPSHLKDAPGLIATLPLRNTQFEEGQVMLTASGRPLFVLQGDLPVYRDLTPGLRGEDIKQLEQALDRLGFDPGDIDGRFDADTGAAVARWYEAAGWEPFTVTSKQRAALRALERSYNEARQAQLAAETVLASTRRDVAAARAGARSARLAAEAELQTRRAERRIRASAPTKATPLTVETARAQAKHGARVAEAELTLSIQEQARITLDPRQRETARAAAEAKVALARAALERARLEGESSVQQAIREAQRQPTDLASLDTAINAAKAKLETARREGDKAIRNAEDAVRLAAFDLELAEARAQRLDDELAQLRARLGVQLPADEIVFLPSLPVRIEATLVAIGDAAAGPTLNVTDNHISIDGALALDAAPLARPGMPVRIDEPTLGIEAAGKIAQVAATPGTKGVDGFHIYFEVAVDTTPVRLEGFSLRLTIPIESTRGAVIAVPLSAVFLAPDGASQVQRQNTDGGLEYLAVEPGMSADGYVEVNPIDGELAVGDSIVIGFERADGGALP